MADKDEVGEAYSRKDLGAGTRGKYYDDYREGTDLVILGPDLAKAFPFDIREAGASRASRATLRLRMRHDKTLLSPPANPRFAL